MNEYQNEAKKFDLHEHEGLAKPNDNSFLEKVMGLVEESGEVAGKMKRIFRQNKDEISAADREAITKELGDVLWYVALIAEYLGFSLQNIADINIKKLTDRQERNKIEGSGDNR